MFNLNVMVDDDVRDKVLGLVRNCLRDAVPEALAKKFVEDGWLDKRFDAAMARLDLPDRLKTVLGSREFWASARVQEAISAAVAGHSGVREVVRAARTELQELATTRFAALEKRLADAATAAQTQVVAELRAAGTRELADIRAAFNALVEDQEAFIRRVVGEELRRRLAP